MNTSSIASGVRELTDQEVAFYHEHGWVKIDQLIAPEFAADLYRAAEASSERNDFTVGDAAGWSMTNLALAGVGSFSSFVFAEEMARNAQRLVNRRRLRDA